MGAYLNFEINKKNLANEAEDFLESSKENNSLGDERILLTTIKDVIWAKANNPANENYFKKRIGKGDIKVSGIDCRTNIDTTEILEIQTKVFESLNKQFVMNYDTNSEAFSEKEYYFSLEQMRRITDNGKLLSGKTAKCKQTRELYEKYSKLFSEPEEIFDISVIKEKDELLMDDGKKYTVEQKGYHGNYYFSLRWSLKGEFSYKKVTDIVSHIKEHIKYVPKVRYDGATCDVESFIVDNGTLVFLELIGQESKVKAITSVLMQGRTKMNDSEVKCDEIGYFSINKAGNRRKLTPLGDGLAHAIVYHSPSISDINFSVIIGRDEDELIKSFSAWLENSQPLPYPKELTTELYQKLKDKDKLQELTTYNVEAIKVYDSIFENEYSDFMEIIIEVAKENGLIDPNAKPLNEEFPSESLINNVE